MNNNMSQVCSPLGIKKERMTTCNKLALYLLCNTENVKIETYVSSSHKFQNLKITSCIYLYMFPLYVYFQFYLYHFFLP